MTGSNIVEITVSGDNRIIFFVLLNFHFIFILFVEGNIVSVVVYVSRM